MRFHLLIQRHGLPITRILWTTTPSTLSDRSTRPSSSLLPAPSTSTPTGAYTIAQFLEDVNDIVPLETETGLFENEFGGQWGLEDYVVEVGGSECLHFMEVEGLLRDGDEVLIRALQIPDLRARRLSGRHQITVDGKHLIDGVPFGRPFLKRSVSSRPAITIPPRKKRRPILPWDRGLAADEEDGEWDPRLIDSGDLDEGQGQLALIRDDDDGSDDESVRDADSQASESDADESDLGEEDLVDELNDLKEDLGPVSETPGQIGGYALREKSASQERIPDKPTPTPSEPRSEGFSPKVAKSVRFTEKAPEIEAKVPSDESESTTSSSRSDTSSDLSSDDLSDSDSSSEDSDSDEEHFPQAKRRRMNPPGEGSAQTRKANRRNKMRRRLDKLKHLGALHEDADFAALRTFDDTHKGPLPVPAPGRAPGKANEQAEFEAKRQKLLRDLESGGVDVDASEKENVPPKKEKDLKHEEADTAEKQEPAEPVKKRLDVASSKRLLFGSLGVRTPRSKEDEEATRRKLAGKPRPIQLKEAGEVIEESEGEYEDWQDKLILQATECVYDDIELQDPPFPFQQRWDFEAQRIIRQRKGLGKRKRDRRLQLDGETEQFGDSYIEDSYVSGDLNYDDNAGYADEVEDNGAVPETAEDLPHLPDDPSSLADLAENEMKKGAIIAFKQLEMSKDTNWQPGISEYRVAETHSGPEDGVFKVRLAKRDRRQKDEDQEEDEEERQYSGFEMPGFEDEDDDGFREVSFSELIAPKLLRGVDGVDGENGDSTPESAAAQRQESMENQVQSEEQPQEDQTMKDEPEPSQSQDAENRGEEDENNEAEENPSPDIRSPTFNGFQSSSSDTSSDDSDSDESMAENKEASDGEPALPPSNQLASHDMPSDSNDHAPELGEIISSPKSFTSFDRILDEFIGSRQDSTADGQSNGEPSQKDEDQTNGKTQSKSTESPGSSPTPQPTDKSEQKQPEELEEPNTDEMVELLSNRSGSNPPGGAEREQSDKSIAETDWSGKERNEEPNQPSPSQAGGIVDLTQDSPPASPDGSDEDFERSQASRGARARKDVPSSQRETRSSGRKQIMTEVSVSPPSRKWKGI